jgi:hypothetical protein
MKTLTDKTTKEVLAGRVAGPFQSPLFTNIQISPLGLVPKKENFVLFIIFHTQRDAPLTLAYHKLYQQLFTKQSMMQSI